MRNLLPENVKRTLLAEYRQRLLIVWAAAISILALVGVVLLLPSFFLLEVRQEALRNQLSVLKSGLEQRGGAEILRLLGDTNRKLRLLTDSKEGPLVHTVLEDAVSRRPPGVSVTLISYSRGENGESELILSGVADTRNALLAFTTSLEKEKALFSDVVLPVENLVADRDVEFSIRVKGAF